MNNTISRLSSQRYFIHCALIIAIIACFLGYRIYIWTQTQSTDNAYIEAEISNVSAQVNGVVQQIFIEENNQVKKGQIIAKIEDHEYGAQNIKALAVVDEAKMEIEIIDQDTKLAEIEKLKSTESLEYAEINLKLNVIDYKRMQELSKDNYASKQKLDNTQMTLEKIRNEAIQAKLNMQISDEKLQLLAIKRLAAIAKLSRVQQEAVLAKKDLDNTLILSPIDGIIGNSSIKIGNYVREGVSLFAVVPQKLHVKANFKETQISKFKPGMQAELVLDCAPNYKITGYIRNISPATGSKFSLLPPANATGNFTKIVQRVPVLIDFEIPAELLGKITPGMSIITSIRLD